ncbi:GIY-YIG nuclease family protein [Dasania sp. GY-MA-18]|uniref:GIY-YIG nuclease family protein n=1 Tax=Dasania phycosphaerae TaxID=2950436 RepID=A0A9J6RMP1_9GAMM|nr:MULTISPECIES: GIY-YIG nuclease family protein [Dasania]MCR8923194.1 GIY-YIG nuclease family protein [Dasania sp. GY-MA-18]MCZ0865626.1 GIY-YIG nuclease family protein [Dasania phycosphaerae]MCZ0869351.1 GIY-YIG nuclease family protein [Dasania phycosphaerae]
MNGIISLNTLFPDLDWQDVKIHVAQKSGKTRPIDVFTHSFDEWQNRWNGNFHSNHCWNRPLIFSIIELPMERDRWLFGGIFNVISHKKGKKNGKDGEVYKVGLHSMGSEFIGRLKVGWTKDARSKGRKPESILADMVVAEVMPEPYVGEDFPGYAYINHDYQTLENLWSDAKQDWLSALIHCQGVYLISDIKTGMRYVGSASGEEGIWSRWATYFKTGGHANNKLLKNLLNKRGNGVDYARANFQFSLLEQASSRDSEQYIIQREVFWKNALLSRGEFGLNDN